MTDLHLHLDGSLSLRTVRRLIAMDMAEEKPALIESDERILQQLQVGERCRDLSEYLDKFVYPLRFLQTPRQLTEAARSLAEELHGLGLTYAELRFAPQSHRQRGMTQEDAVRAVLDGLRESPLPTGLILCCMRGRGNEAENLETVELTKRFLGQGVCAADLAGAEGLFPTAGYVPLFRRAADLGVPFTIHAGEGDGPDSIRAALDLGAGRIGHGIRSAEDPALLARLREEKITLEICPSSNLHTGLYHDYRELPIPRLLDAGVAVTVNSDNMAVSHTDVLQELRHVQEAFGLSDSDLAVLQKNADEAAFGRT